MFINKKRLYIPLIVKQLLQMHSQSCCWLRFPAIQAFHGTLHQQVSRTQHLKIQYVLHKCQHIHQTALVPRILKKKEKNNVQSGWNISHSSANSMFEKSQKNKKCIFMFDIIQEISNWLNKSTHLFLPISRFWIK